MTLVGSWHSPTRAACRMDARAALAHRVSKGSIVTNSQYGRAISIRETTRCRPDNRRGLPRNADLRRRADFLPPTKGRRVSAGRDWIDPGSDAAGTEVSPRADDPRVRPLAESSAVGSEVGLLVDAPGVRPLAQTKISAPLLHAGMIDRPRVREALEESGEAALTLIAAPAGYGKTTAVRSWCANRDAALAWVRLDKDDNDPVRMWTAVATAVDRVRAGLGRPAMRRMSVIGESLEAVVDELSNSLNAYGRDLVLVLDDLHLVTRAECIAALNHAVANFPPNVRLIVISRADPALRLAQLRASGELAELRASTLAFTTAEANQLLADHQVGLSAADVELLHVRTEGWPAALSLAALWLRSVEDPHEAVAVFGGDHSFIADYLAAEVIASLDEVSRAFLLQVCVLREFTAELCDAVLDRSDSEVLLAQLESDQSVRRASGACGRVSRALALRGVRSVPPGRARPGRSRGHPSAREPLVPLPPPVRGGGRARRRRRRWRARRGDPGRALFPADPDRTVSRPARLGAAARRRSGHRSIPCSPSGVR